MKTDKKYKINTKIDIDATNAREKLHLLQKSIIDRANNIFKLHPNFPAVMIPTGAGKYATVIKSLKKTKEWPPWQKKTSSANLY